MKLSTLMLVMVLAETIFGLGFLLAPGVMMELFGVSGSPMLFFITRMFGAAIISLAILFWLSRAVTEAGAKHAVVITGLVYNLLATFLIGGAVTSSLIKSSAWGTVGLHFLLTVGFAYFAFMKRA